MGAPTQAPPFRAARTLACVFKGCDDPPQTRNLCWGHYAQWVNGGELRPKRAARTPRLCGFDGCSRKHSRHGWCATHALQAAKSAHMKPIGARRTKYLILTGGGYAKVFNRDHPNADSHGYVLQHVLVMSVLLGRPLLPGENVHHRNGDRADNRPDNLELWSHAQPKGQRVDDKVAWAIQILQTYNPAALSEGASR